MSSLGVIRRLSFISLVFDESQQQQQQSRVSSLISGRTGAKWGISPRKGLIPGVGNGILTITIRTVRESDATGEHPGRGYRCRAEGSLFVSNGAAMLRGAGEKWMTGERSRQSGGRCRARDPLSPYQGTNNIPSVLGSVEGPNRPWGSQAPPGETLAGGFIISRGTSRQLHNPLSGKLCRVLHF